jgi:hypothetical protein
MKDRFPTLAIGFGPDSMVDLLLTKSRDRGFPGDEIERTVLFVFREPPRPGSRIEIRHQYWRPWARNLAPYVFSYRLQDSQPFVVIENRTQAGGSGGTITYKVFVDGHLIGEKTIQIY